MAVDIICTLCNESVDRAHLSGLTKIGKRLVPYSLCYECFQEVPSHQDSPLAKKTGPTRQEFWDGLRDKLRYTEPA